MKLKRLTGIILASVIALTAFAGNILALDIVIEPETDDVLSGSAVEADVSEDIDLSYEDSTYDDTDDDTYDGYIVKLKDNANISMYSLDSDETEIGFVTTDSLEEAEEYVEQGLAEYIEPNYKVELFSVPNDAMYSQQWHHSVISSQDAWDLEIYGDGVNVAVIDSGCYEHSDISDNLLDGYNYLDDNYDLTDNIGHGTHVSGIIAAEMNSYGVVGLANNAKIVPLKCFEDDEDTVVSDVIKAIYAAVDVYDCRIINMSWGISSYSRTLNDAIDYADRNGVIMIAAAGNDGTSSLHYPAAFDSVIGVGSISKDKTVSSFSQHNSSVFAVAPGENILSLGTNGNYAQMEGTSQAAPMVTALAALLMGIDNDLSTDELKNCIINTSEDLGSSGYDYYYGYGLINVGEAVRYILSDENYYISNINSDNGKINFGVWNNSGDELSGVIITEGYYDIYADNINISEISLSNDETQTYEFNYSGGYDDIKTFIWNSVEDMMPIDETGVSSEAEITITDYSLDSDGNITLACSVENASANQQLSVMVVKYNDDETFDYDNVTYYNQLDYSKGFNLTFNAGVSDNGTYALRVGGTGISTPEYVVLSYEDVTSIIPSTTTTTTEATTESTTSTETTTKTTSSSSSSGGGGGGGGSSSSSSSTTTTTTTEATTETTTVEATTETTTEEEDIVVELYSSEAKEIKVTIGSDIVSINDSSYSMGIAPYIQSSSNSTLVPLRFVAVAIIGEDVDNADTSSVISWNGETKTAEITAGSDVISFTAGSSYMTVNGNEVLMNNGVTAEITDGRMFIPFRALGEALGVSVDWESNSKTAIYNVN